MLVPQNKLIKAGDFYYFPGGLQNAPAIPTQSEGGANHDTIKTILDALSFTSIGALKNFETQHTLENESVVIVDNCGIGEIDRSVEKIASVTFDRLDTGDIEAFADMFGLFITDMIASVVSITTETTAIRTVGSPFLLENSYRVAPLSIVITNTTGPTVLTLDTDYSIRVDGGRTYIVPITVQTAGNLTIAYDYDQLQGKISGYNYDKTSLQYGLYKFVSCPIPYVDGAVNYTRQWIYYFVKHYPGEAISQQFINMAVNELEGSSITLTGALGGQILFYYEDTVI